MASSSRGAVLAAILGNATITVAKFVAFAITGSGSMLSEGIHSVADTANQTLLFIGIRRSERPADDMFHYGYGADRYLYALLSAIGIFVLGCGVTVYHGIRSLIEPAPVTFSWVSVAVLAVAFVLDGAVFLTALRGVQQQKGERPLLRFLQETTDPTIAAVLLEDAAACTGVLIAGAGIWLSHITGDPTWDAVGAILIGLMLGLVAIWLGVRNRALLLGPALTPEEHRTVVEFLAAQPAVTRVRAARSRVVGSGDVRFQADLDFDGAWLGRRVVHVLSDCGAGTPDDEARRQACAEAMGEAVLQALSDEVDRIEAELARRFPQLGHVDLEVEEPPLSPVPGDG